MPARRTRSRGRVRPDLIQLDKWLRLELESGGHLGAPTEDLEDAWDAHAEAILAEWIAKTPGTRPYAWWRFDSPEPRREANPILHPGHYLTALGDEGRRRGGEVLVPSADGKALVPWLEPERDYLERHGLLTDGE